ncbi:MAG: T9SS type A sorting domain-containing protein [Salibacteraceae bacterium]
MKKFSLLLWCCLFSFSAAFAQLTTTNGPWQVWGGTTGNAPAGWNTNCNVGGFVNPGLGTPNAWQQTFTGPNYPGSTANNYIYNPNSPFNGFEVQFFRLCLNINNINGCQQYFFTGTADDRLTLFVNGTQVNVPGNPTANWQATLANVNITNLLNCGANVIGVQVNEVGGSSTPRWFIGNVTTQPVQFPFVNLGFDSDCENQVLQLSAQTAGNFTYEWTGPNGFTSTQQNPVINNPSAANNGQYTCTVSLANAVCCSASFNINVTIDESCCEAIDWDTDFDFLTGCLEVEVTDVSNNPAGVVTMPVTWIWGDNTPNTLTAIGGTATHTYANPGTYTVCMVYQVFPDLSTCCHDTVCKTITVGDDCKSIPDPTFTSTTNTFCTIGGCCVATTLNLNTLLTPTSVIWNWGDGSFSNGNAPNFGGWHDYGTSGNYTITVTVIYHPPCNPKLCCVKTFSRRVRVRCGIIWDPIDPVKGKERLAVDEGNTTAAPATTVKIYPNPVSKGSYLTVELSPESTINTINVIDMMGKVILQVPTTNAQQLTLELPGDMPTGVYFVTADDQSFQPQKVVVVN